MPSTENICVDCGKTCKTLSALLSHRRWKHGSGDSVECTVASVGEGFVCPDCGNAFASERGLNVHRRAAHPEEYHASRQPVGRVKARWSHEELVLVARAELEIRRTKPKAALVRELHSCFPDRSLEAIKSMRTKNPRYLEILASLEVEESDSTGGIRVDSTDVQSQLEDGGNINATDDGWVTPLLCAITLEHLGVDNLDWVVAGCPDQTMRNKIDSLFASWVAHLAGKGRKTVSPSQSDCVHPQRFFDQRRRRRAQYSAIQHLYAQKPSAAAHKVLDGSWRNPEPLSTPTVNEFQRAWQPIFETPSIKDTRHADCIGGVQWSLVAPVTPDEILKVLSAGADSAPGPDGIR